MKVCKYCGTEYFSAACPTCGFIPNNQNRYSNPPTNNVVYYREPAKNKSKMWLWVLGWLFMFPIPLSILIYRSKNLSKNVRIAIIVGVWAFFYLSVSLAIKLADRVLIIQKLKIT